MILKTYQEKILETIDDRVDCEYRFPIFSQNIQAHITIQVNIRMINLSFTLHFWWLMRVIGSNFETKHKSTTSVKTLKQ